MRKYVAWSLCLLFYAHTLPWSFAENFNYKAHDITSDNGAITGFSTIGSPAFSDALTLYGNDLITKGPWVDVRAFIPSTLHAAIAARTDNTNLQPYLQSAFDNVPTSGGTRTVFFPDGLYNVEVDSIYVRRSNIRIVLSPGAEIHGSGDFTQVSGDGAAIFMLKGTLATPIHHIGIYGGKISGVNSGSYDGTKDFHAIRTPSNGESCSGVGGVTACSAVYNLEIKGVYFPGFKAATVWGQGYNLLMDGNTFDDMLPNPYGNAINLTYDNAIYVNNTIIGGMIGIQHNGAKVTISNNVFDRQIKSIVIGESVGNLTSDYIIKGNRIYLSSLATTGQQFGNGQAGIEIDDGATDILVEGNLLKATLNNASHQSAKVIWVGGNPRGAKVTVRNNDIVMVGGGDGIYGEINSVTAFDNLYLLVQGNNVELRDPIKTLNSAYRFFHAGDNTVRMDLDIFSNIARGFTNSDYALDIRQSTASGTGPLDWNVRDFFCDNGTIILQKTDGLTGNWNGDERPNETLNATSYAIPVPATSTSSGWTGMTAADNTYYYWAYDKNKWRRVAYDNTW